MGKKFSFPLYIIGLVVIGGKDPKTGNERCHDVFISVFYKKKNLKCWEDVGAFPSTHACSKWPKVRHDVGHTGPADEMQIAMVEMQQFKGLMEICYECIQRRS